MKEKVYLLILILLSSVFLTGCILQGNLPDDIHNPSSRTYASEEANTNYAQDSISIEGAGSGTISESGAITDEKSQEVLRKVRPVSPNQYNQWEKQDEICIRTADVCVPDAETALSMGDLLLTQFQEKGFSPGFTPQLIEYQDDPSVWIVSCWKDSDVPDQGGMLSIAIRKDNAQVIKMWLGEQEDDGRPEKEIPAEPSALSEEQKDALLRSIRLLPESEVSYWETLDEKRTFSEACVPDAQTALLLGNILLTRFQREGYYLDYLPQLIEYQTDPLIWIVSYWEDLGPDSTAAEVSFAIREKDAQVISIWLGE